MKGAGTGQHTRAYHFMFGIKLLLLCFSEFILPVILRLAVQIRRQLQFLRA